MTIRALLVVGMVLGAGCDDLRRYFSGDEVSAGPAAPANPSGKPLLVSMREAVIEGRSVVLDRRVTRALADLGALVGTSCNAIGKAGGTKIACGADTIGELPELPDFPALRDQLVAVAKRAPVPPGTPREDPAYGWLLEGSTGLARARAAGHRWAKGERTGAVALDGLHGLLAALYAEQDVLELADSVGARALALLAIADASAPRSVEEALLARLLGYDAAAERLATPLAPADPLRAYLTRAPDLVDKVVADRKASPLSLSLAHRAALEEHEREEAPVLRARMAPAQLSDSGVHAARLRSPRFREPLAMAPLLPMLGLVEARALAGQPLTAPPIHDAARVDDEAGVAATLPQLGHALGVQAATVAQALDRAVEAASKDAGPFLDKDVVADHFRALVGLADDAVRAGVFEQLGLHDENDFVADLERGRPARFAGGIAWLKLTAQLASAKTPAPTLLAALRKSVVFGPEPLLELLHGFWTTGEWGDPIWAQLVTEIRRRLDSRPAHLGVLIYLADVRHDFVRKRALDDAWLATIGGRRAYLPARRAIEEGREAEVHATILDAKATIDDKNNAFAALEDAELVTDADAEAMALAALRADDRMASADRVMKLLGKRNPARAKQLVGEWLRKHPGGEMTIERAHFLADLAALQQATGDLAGADKTVTPALVVGAGAPMRRAALIAAARGDADRAEKLARACMERYPASDTVGLLVELLLRAGRVKDAAQVLAHAPVQITGMNLMNDVGPHVARGIQDETGVVQFLTALKEAGFDMSRLYGLSLAFHNAKRADLAFAVTSRIPAQGLAIAQVAAVSYKHLKAWRGVAAADAWAKKSLPPPLLLPLAIFLQTEEQIDAMFTVTPDPPRGEQGDSVWLCRAQALLMLRETSGPRWDRVLANYQHKDGSYYHTVGRHLVGLEPESAAIAAATDPRRACEIASYLSALALSQGRIADASDWFQVTLQNDNGHLTEYTLTLRVADALSRLHKSMAWMEKNAKWPTK